MQGDEVELWQAELDLGPQELLPLRELLSADELARADRFVFERDRVRFTVARGLLRRLLGGYLGVEPARVAIAYGPQGKPLVDGVRFNLSHSQGLALFVFSPERELGVDVEGIRPLQDAERIAQRHLPPEAAALVGSLSGAPRLEAFYRAWTRKEACVKAAGAGVFEAVDEGLWQVRDLDPAPGWVGALAVEGPGWRLSVRRFPPA